MKYFYVLLLGVLIVFFSCNNHEDIRPKYFDNFWNDSLKELERTLISEEVEKDSIVSDKKWSLYKIKSYNDIYLYAWVSEPITSDKYPIKIRFSGISKSLKKSDEIPNAWFLKEKYTINVLVDIRGQGLSTNQISNIDFLTNGLENQKTYIYKGAYLDAVRIVDFISKNPKSDGNIIVTGGGQGGALSVAAAALNPKVTMCVIGFPFFSDIDNYDKRKWPMSIFMFYCMKNEIDYFDLVDRLSYFDMIYFADKIKIPIFIKTQETDNITPVGGILKFYNKIKLEEKLVYVDSCKNHGCVTNSQKAIELEKEFIKKHMLKGLIKKE